MSDRCGRSRAAQLARIAARGGRDALLVIGSAVACAAWGCTPAVAEVRLTVHYAISIAGISVGEGTWKVQLDKRLYEARADGSFTGMWRVLVGGDVFSETHGTAARGRPVATRYEANFGLDEAIEAVRMELRDGTVTDVDVRPPLPDRPDRISLGEADRRGVTDPLTAGLVPIAGSGNMLTPAACERTLPMFDGGHRWDITLSFERMDAVNAGEGYQGPVVVCAMAYRPIAGHSPSGWRVKHLIGKRGMEIWLAPVNGTRLLAPFRISVPTLFGTAMLDATKFESATRP
jgi:hypothetical protein